MRRVCLLSCRVLTPLFAQKAALRIVRRGRVALPGSVEDAVILPEVAAVQFQLVTVTWALAGWAVTHFEDKVRTPAPATVGAVLTFAGGLCAWAVPVATFWISLPIGVLIVWRARGREASKPKHE